MRLDLLPCLCRRWLPVVGVLLAFATQAGLNLQIGQNFSGATLHVNSFVVPPDSDGAVGPANFVEFVNGRFSVYDKTNGTQLQTMSDDAFWNSAGVELGS